MSLARTHATGGGGMLDELVLWSSSFHDDLHFVREDLLGSAAHATMLGRTGIIRKEDSDTLRQSLLSLFRAHEEGAPSPLPTDEEDVHMAVEAWLTSQLGPVAGRLHTARSRNDQVATCLRLYVRRVASETLAALSHLTLELADRAQEEMATLLPAYTHRQRAQPISGGFLFASWCASLLRAGKLLEAAIDSANVLPLGSGACSGTSLPIDRLLTARLLGFPTVTTNALDSVGDRDFALDWTYAGARVLLSLGKLSADIIDFSTSEFGMISLDGSIAAGSSMMPQKKNPDLFELVRGKSSQGAGNLVAMLTLVKGLASGYNRDQQEDRRPILETAPLVQKSIRAVSLGIPHITFARERCLDALRPGFTQATDLAEALVRRGVPFREAYKAVGALVAHAVREGVALTHVDPAVCARIHPEFDREAIDLLDPAKAVAAKESIGGTGPKSVLAQLEEIRGSAARQMKRATEIPSLAIIAALLEEEP